MKKVILGIGLIIIATGFQQCKNDPEKRFLQSETKEWFDFKDGSQWRYMLSSDTSNIDTVTLKDYSNGFGTPDVFNTEFVYYKIKSQKSFSVNLGIEASLNDPMDRITVINLEIDTPAYGPIFWYKRPDFLGYPLDTFNLYPNYNIADRNYADVLMYSPFKNKLYKTVYFAKNIGIVRKDLINGEKWLLKSYNVIR